jgi:hypothetical protein
MQEIDLGGISRANGRALITPIFPWRSRQFRPTGTSGPMGSAATLLLFCMKMAWLALCRERFAGWTDADALRTA